MFSFLSGVRVIDLTSIVLGPFATKLLADFGAEIIKVEPPGGDLMRAVRPGRSRNMGAAHLNLNRNKKSIAIDLKSAQGMARMQGLLETADVFVHNMRSKAALRLGLDAASLRSRHPRLLYCSAPGFGAGGRYADQPAYDDVVQALSGLASLNGKDGEPRFLPTVICDKVGGMHLAMAVLAGLFHRQRTGQGCEVEVPMFETMVSFLMVELLGGASFVPPLGPLGYARLFSPYRRPYRTKDGYMCILPYSGKQWEKFLVLVDRPDLAGASWVQDPISRGERIDELYEAIAEAAPLRRSEQWVAALRQLDIPCAPVRSIEEVLQDGHLRDVGMFQAFTHPTEGNLTGIRSPFIVVGADEHHDLPAPELGEDNESTP